MNAFARGLANIEVETQVDGCMGPTGIIFTVAAIPLILLD